MSRSAVPFRQFVLKVHSRCDLACDHCYVYEAADQSWRSRPAVMAEDTITRAAQRIAQHARDHELTEVAVVLHGGEPLLAGVSRLGHMIGVLQRALAGWCELDLRIHTNGVQLNQRFCDLFAATGCRVGISLDGNQAANDRHRRYLNGRSSYDRVIKAIGLLRSAPYRQLYAGLLCTIDVRNDPLAVYQALLDLEPPRVDFLLPHATWDEPPWRPLEPEHPYAAWLGAIFDRWNADGRPMGVRLFDSIIETTRGGESLTEALGLAPSDLIVIETDGSYEQVDSLKAAYDGAPLTGLDVFHHDLDQVAMHPGILARQTGMAGLCQKCQTCPVVKSCGGGLYPHRYRTGTGFHNPSVYCGDLERLITHVRRRTSGESGHAVPHRVHTTSAAEIDALASGYGGTEEIAQLAAAQHSLRRALLARAYDAAVDAAGDQAQARALSAAWAVLTRIDEEQPQVLTDVLSHPYFRVWAMHILHRLDPEFAETAPRSRPLPDDLGHLAAFAATAAIRGGVDAELAVPVCAGVIHLPTLGCLVTAGPEPAGLAQVTVAGPDGVTVRAGAREWRAVRDLPGSGLDFAACTTAAWQPVRQLSVRGLSVTVEDTDPYRDCYDLAVGTRMSAGQFADWDDRFAAAWRLIQREYSAYAPGLATGLATLVPLSGTQAGHEVSATARNAFGAVAAALPADPATLALLLLHEFQHVKLYAVLDQFDLFDRADTRGYRVAWRPDPRPLEGVLQGTYAHIAVTEFWRVRWLSGGPSAQAAAECFAHWRDGTAAALQTLACSGSLTPLGERFVDRMRSTVEPWLGEPARRPAAAGAVAPS